MKHVNPVARPPEREPENVREALELFNYDMMTVAYIIGGIGAQIDLLTENTDYPGSDEWRYQSIMTGLSKTSQLCADYIWKRADDTEEGAMDRLPAESPKDEPEHQEKVVSLPTKAE